MARKQRLKYKWKQFGWSIMSVGILSCGAGFRSRSPGYLPVTGPTKVRIEVPKDLPTSYQLPPLDLGDDELILDSVADISPVVSTNTIPPMREEHFSVNSQPDELPTVPPLILQQNNTAPKPFEQLAQEFLPPGYIDILEDPIERENLDLKDLLPMFTKGTNQIKNGIMNKKLNPDPLPNPEPPTPPNNP